MVFYPRGANRPNPCRYCKGTGRIRNDLVNYECTSCNGTGIDGDPRWVVAIFVGILILYGVLAWIF